MRSISVCSFTAVILLVSFPTPSFAQYLDPGTGSYIFQMLIAGGAALFYTTVKFKTQIFTFLKHLLQKRADESARG